MNRGAVVFQFSTQGLLVVRLRLMWRERGRVEEANYKCTMAYYGSLSVNSTNTCSLLLPPCSLPSPPFYPSLYFALSLPACRVDYTTSKLQFQCSLYLLLRGKHDPISMCIYLCKSSQDYIVVCVCVCDGADILGWG